MRNRGLGLVVAVTLMLSLLASACGGSPAEPMALEDYFARLDAIVLDMTQQLDILDGEFADEMMEAYRAYEEGDDDEYARALATYWRDRLRAENGALQAAIDEIRGISPPAQAEDWHHELVSGAEDVVRVSEDLASRLDGIKSMAAMDRVSDEIDVEAPGERLEDACYALEDIAEKNNLDANLQCSYLSLTF